MRERLLIGPVLILAIILGLAADQWLEGRPAPSYANFVTINNWPPGVVLVPILCLLAVFAARELAAMFKAKNIEASRRVFGTVALLGVIISSVVPVATDAVSAIALVSTCAAVSLAGSMIYYARNRTVQGVLTATGGSMLSFVYLGLLAGFLVAIRREHSAWVLTWVLLVTKSCDIGALFTGKAIGRHKMAPWLSPGKTWEGLIGGVVVACLVGVGGMWLLQRYTGFQSPAVIWTVVAGFLFAVVGQLGDLAKSVFKRDAGLKDSGTVLPGFGGIIDMIDSPLLVGPVAFWWLRMAI